MFKAITIKSKEGTNSKLDVGFVAEALLFYGTINLIADKFTLPELLQMCGVDEVKELVKMGRLQLFIKESHIGVPMITQKEVEMYDVQTLSSADVSQESIIRDSLVEIGITGDSIKIHTKDLLDLSKSYKYDLTYMDEINEDLKDSDYLRKGIAASINFWNPGVNLKSEDFQAKYYHVGTYGPFKMHKLETNLDFSKYQNTTPSGLILNIAESRGNLHIAGRFNSEIADKPLYSQIMQTKFNSLVQLFNKNQIGISQFQEIVLSDYKAIGEALKARQIKFSDFLEILQKADKFRDWLQKIEQDKNIVAEYFKAVTTETWVDKLPTKGVRFALFTGAGLLIDAIMPTGLGTATGISLGAGDTFLLDKVLKGWKPNQFVDELKEELPKSNDVNGSA